MSEKKLVTKIIIEAEMTEEQVEVLVSEIKIVSENIGIQLNLNFDKS